MTNTATLALILASLALASVAALAIHTFRNR